jgi:hypothetical protein
MDQSQAAKSVAKKLSALRATLDDEEQRYLDGIVEGSYSVSAHAMDAARTRARTRDEDEAEAHAMDAARTRARTRDEDEAEAHAMDAARTRARTRDEDEAEAHAMDAARTRARTRDEDEAEAHGIGGEAFQIVYDEETDSYRLR